MSSKIITDYSTQPAGTGIKFVYDKSFKSKKALTLYHPLNFEKIDFSSSFMPEEYTRDLAKRMHYCGFRFFNESNITRKKKWKKAYLDLRNLIVLGNRKLVFKAVNKWTPMRYMADDNSSNCTIILIQAVAAFNPWKGIRFSTYSFTCLMRALSRLNYKHSSDKLVQCESLDNMVTNSLELSSGSSNFSPKSSSIADLDKYFSKDCDILDDREKLILRERFGLGDKPLTSLEEVGKILNLSKERIRQIQFTALEKLRKVLVPAVSS